MPKPLKLTYTTYTKDYVLKLYSNGLDWKIVRENRKETQLSFDFEF